MKGDELNKYHLHMHVYSRHIALLRALRTLNLPFEGSFKTWREGTHVHWQLVLRMYYVLRIMKMGSNIEH